MTTRNLVQTWRDVLFAQYEADLADQDVALPIRYITKGYPWNKTMVVVVRERIPLPTFRRAMRDHLIARRRDDDPTWEGEHISVELFVPFHKRADQADGTGLSDSEALHGQ